MNKKNTIGIRYGDEGSEIKIWIHGALYWILIFGWYRGLQLVPIGDAEAIVFLAPVLIVILGRLVLKEPLSVVFPGTIILTLSGLSNPSSTASHSPLF